VTDIDTFIGFHDPIAVAPCHTVAAIAMVQDLFAVKEIPYTLLMLVGRGFNAGTHYWVTALTCIYIASRLLGLTCTGIPLFIWLHTHEPDTPISLKPKPIILNF
jgi:DHA1 family bicyclomycin/chloramphenicol resistance-like MFS transporter